MEKKHLTFNIDAKIIKNLKMLAVQLDKSMTDLFLEAIELLFKKYEKKEKK